MAEGGLPSMAPPIGKPIPVEEDEPEVDPAGRINKREAAHHCHLISDTLQDFSRWIRDGEIQDVLKQLIEEVQTVIKYHTKIDTQLHLYSIKRPVRRK